VFVGAWIVLMACATLGVVATWIALATDLQNGAAGHRDSDNRGDRGADRDGVAAR
jgi:hypothetical protein